MRKTVSFGEREVQELRKAIKEVDPHEHYEGMNECWRCDQDLLLVAARLLRELHAKLPEHP